MSSTAVYPKHLPKLVVWMSIVVLSQGSSRADQWNTFNGSLQSESEVESESASSRGTPVFVEPWPFGVHEDRESEKRLSLELGAPNLPGIGQNLETGREAPYAGAPYPAEPYAGELQSGGSQADQDLVPACYLQHGPHRTCHHCRHHHHHRGSRQLEAEFHDGFALVSRDEEFELRFHILNQVDYKAFWPGDQEPAAQDGVYIPRMRVYFEGRLTEPYRYEISLQRSVEGVFDLLDANLDIRVREEFQIRLGRTLIPYSYTWYDHLEQYFIAPERPLFPLNYGLSRAAGAQVWGQDDDRTWQYSAGIFDGRVAGIADNSTTVDAVGYLNFRPFARRSGGFFRFLNFGGSLVVGEQKVPSEILPGRTSIQTSENDEAAFAASAVFIEFREEVLASGRRSIGAIHVANYAGPVSIEAEWNALDNEVLDERTSETIRVGASGFHVTCASFLTGETVEGREEVVPLRPLDPRRGCTNLGAFEAFARYSLLQFSNAVFDDDLADRNEWTDRVGMTDIGVNWYLNRWAKFYFDWQHASYASPVLINANTGRRSKYNDLLWARCQLYF